MSRRQLGLYLIILAQSCPVLFAQDEHKIRYKFVPGATATYRGSLTTAFRADARSLPASLLPAQTLSCEAEGEATVKMLCRSVDGQGRGHMELSVPALNVVVRVQGLPESGTARVRWSGGTLTATGDGGLVLQDHDREALGETLRMKFPLVITPAGEFLPESGSAEDFGAAGVPELGEYSSLFGAGKGTLPETALKVGDHLSFSGGTELGGGRLAGSVDIALTAVEPHAGRQIARIESNGQINMAGAEGIPLGETPMGTVRINSLNAALAAANFVDLDRGQQMGATVHASADASLVDEASGATVATASATFSMKVVQETPEGLFAMGGHGGGGGGGVGDDHSDVLAIVIGVVCLVLMGAIVSIKSKRPRRRAAIVPVWTVRAETPGYPPQVVTIRGRIAHIGSGPVNNVVLADHLVSERHLRVCWTPIGFCVEDLGSRGGTWTGDDRIVRPYYVPSGGSVRAGTTLLTIS